MFTGGYAIADPCCSANDMMLLYIYTLVEYPAFVWDHRHNYYWRKKHLKPPITGFSWWISAFGLMIFPVLLGIFLNSWVCLKIGCPTDLFYQCMEVSSNGGTPKSSKSLDHVSIETNGFGDPPFQDATRHIYPLVNQHNYGKSPFFMGKSTINGDFP